MKYYTIQDNNVLIADKESALTKYYDNVFELPADYEPLKYIIGEEKVGKKTIQVLVPNPNYEEEKAAQEQERISRLYLTKREVFLALYHDKGITPEQIKAQITNPEALIEFEYANEYYRFNPLIDQVGTMLGYTKEDLDYLFINKEFPAKD